MRARAARARFQWLKIIAFVRGVILRGFSCLVTKQYVSGAIGRLELKSLRGLGLPRENSGNPGGYYIIPTGTI